VCEAPILEFVVVALLLRTSQGKVRCLEENPLGCNGRRRWLRDDRLISTHVEAGP